MQTERLTLLEQNIIHEFDHELVGRNLRGCYGTLIGRFYDAMLPDIAGNRVLDVGCGFGLFSHRCRQDGFQVHAIDVDDQSLDIARSEYHLDCRNESVYETSLPPDSIDTAVFNDVIPHLELPRLKPEMDRLGVRRLMVLDSNIANPMLRLYRWATGHEEHQDYSMREVVAGLEGIGFRATRVSYYNYLSLPISGGLQRNPIPIVHRFPGIINLTDRMLASVVPWTLMSRFLAFRYLAIFDRLA